MNTPQPRREVKLARSFFVCVWLFEESRNSETLKSMAFLIKVHIIPNTARALRIYTPVKPTHEFYFCDY